MGTLNTRLTKKTLALPLPTLGGRISGHIFFDQSVPRLSSADAVPVALQKKKLREAFVRSFLGRRR